jgi:hypothetical protein
VIASAILFNEVISASPGGITMAVKTILFGLVLIVLAASMALSYAGTSYAGIAEASSPATLAPLETSPNDVMNPDAEMTEKEVREKILEGERFRRFDQEDKGDGADEELKDGIRGRDARDRARIMAGEDSFLERK